MNYLNHAVIIPVILSIVFCAYCRRYEYGQVLGKSLLFYEAQRSGKLPTNNRIPWRKDSFLTDVGDLGEDLSGGYFDDGGFVKFTFPMAFTTTILGWGILDFTAGYTLANELGNGMDAMKWATDYLLKVRALGSNALYVQVGNFDDDRMVWTRPEDWPGGIRQTYKINGTASPGSDVQGEVAAALSVASMLFNNTALPNYNPSYATRCLQSAKELYNLANTTRGKYSDSVPAILPYYGSFSGYGDELGWAAAWLYRATRDPMYLQDVNKHWIDFKLDVRPSQFTWDWKTAGLQVLLAKMNLHERYSVASQAFCDWAVHQAPRTPRNLVFISERGTLRHAANIAFICLLAANADIQKSTYLPFAKSQIDYMLGDSGRSYVVGHEVTENCPKQAAHRASSCNAAPTPCTWDNYRSTANNPMVLTGALVGGPSSNDSYSDNRQSLQNEVTLDFNAGFQSALAALTQFKAQGELVS